jgi:hypothetical protein
MQTFVYNFAVLKSVTTQPLKERVLDFQHIFSQLAMQRPLSCILKKLAFLRDRQRLTRNNIMLLLTGRAKLSALSIQDAAFLLMHQAVIRNLQYLILVIDLLACDLGHVTSLQLPVWVRLIMQVEPQS